ncbi:18.1 kDa class I heat shock protein-like [Andrographis paniculata]|uniref:18.1 kDa class I heat shock protein-like n=1 Tax=Andrographis paniculata TaxID=175694 RepID=UPI0021E986D9|nr:18.1 kDa class I heat shock protein-like [Andrographis paniculata]
MSLIWSLLQIIFFAQRIFQSILFRRRRRRSNGPNPICIDVWKKESPNGYVFKADVSGLKKEDLKIAVKENKGKGKGNVLRIDGEGLSLSGGTNNTLKQKRFCKFFMPTDAKHGQIEATLHRGVLTIIVPKNKEATRSCFNSEKF